MSLRPLLLLCLVAAAISTACSDGTGPASLVGRYSLRSINDQTLPAAALGPSLESSIRVTAGTLELKPGGKYSRSLTFTSLGNTEGQPITTTADGTYVLTNGGQLELDLDSDPSVLAATRSGDEIELVLAPGNVFTFAR